MNNIRLFFQNASTKAKILISGGVLLFISIIIISIISIVSANQTAPEYLNITNFSENLSELDLPDYYKTQIQQYVWAYIKDLPGVSQVNQSNQISQVDAVIRKDSLEKSGDDGNYSVLVDIEPLHYSFHVSFFWNPEISNQSYVEPGYYIECPYPDEIIYHDTPCPLETTLDQLARLLPATIESNSYTINARIAASSIGRFLLADIQSCDPNVDLKKAEFTLRDWIKQNSLDPNNININTIKTCPSP